MGSGEFEITIDFKGSIDRVKFFDYMLGDFLKNFIKPMGIAANEMGKGWILKKGYDINYNYASFLPTETKEKGINLSKIEDEQFYLDLKSIKDELFKLLDSKAPSVYIVGGTKIFCMAKGELINDFYVIENLAFSNSSVRVPILRIGINIVSDEGGSVDFHTYSRVFIRKNVWDEEKEDWVEGPNPEIADMNLELLAKKIKELVERFIDDVSEVYMSNLESGPHYKEGERIMSTLKKFVPKYRSEELK